MWESLDFVLRLYGHLELDQDNTCERIMQFLPLPWRDTNCDRSLSWPLQLQLNLCPLILQSSLTSQTLLSRASLFLPMSLTTSTLPNFMASGRRASPLLQSVSSANMYFVPENSADKTYRRVHRFPSHDPSLLLRPRQVRRI